MCSKKTKSFVERKSAIIKRSVIFIFSSFCKKEISTNYSGLFTVQVGYLQYIFNIDDKTSVLLGLQKQNPKTYKRHKVSRPFFLIVKKKKILSNFCGPVKTAGFQCNYNFLFQTCSSKIWNNQKSQTHFFSFKIKKTENLVRSS